MTVEDNIFNINKNKLNLENLITSRIIELLIGHI